MAAPPADEWSQFRGPGGCGIAPDREALPATLDREQNLLWRRPLEDGHSSPCIRGSRIFLTGATKDDPPALITSCLDRDTGELCWQRQVEAQPVKRLHEQNHPASPTAAADAERVYVYFGGFGLLCYDHQGVEQWRRSLPPPENSFGVAASPIRAGEYLLFVHDSDRESYLEAMQPATGATVWRTDRPGFKAAWSTPQVWNHRGTDEILVYGVSWLTAYSLADGAERWAVPGLSDEPIVTPVTGAGLVFVSSYNMRTSPEVVGVPQWSTLLAELDADSDQALDAKEAAENRSILSRPDADGEGDHPLQWFFRFLDRDKDGRILESEWQNIHEWLGTMVHANGLVAIRPSEEGTGARIAWQHSLGVPECPSPLYYRERVYLVANGGLVTCLDAATGEVKYQGRLDSRGPCYASPVAGDGKIYSASARGVVTVWEAGDTLNVLARNDLGERIMATPALLGGRVYVRTEQALHAFGTVVSPRK